MLTLILNDDADDDDDAKPCQAPYASQRACGSSVHAGACYMQGPLKEKPNVVIGCFCVISFQKTKCHVLRPARASNTAAIDVAIAALLQACTICRTPIRVSAFLLVCFGFQAAAVDAYTALISRVVI